MVAPMALTSLLENGQLERENRLADDRASKASLKTWLGLRYDRPAVPKEFVQLAQRIAAEVEHRAKAHNDVVRDVLVQFEPGNPPVYHLYAIMNREADTAQVEEWLTQAALKVPQEFGVLGALEARTDADISLQIIESSFAVDLTQITWR